ncbi:MAG: hypothetical protein LC627_00845 [Verrucomicrobiaceae bacterium]|nr:hypothetical protein [Verrucomicrobiaceae bacterium]
MLFLKTSFSPTKLLVAASICCASLVSVPTPAAAACQAGQAGCVLPVGEAAPLPVAQPAPAPAPAPVYEETDGDGKSWLPIILGLLALGALAYFLDLPPFFDDDDPDSP